jgi:multicomponent Na+:H+ antiporter subunit E
MDAYGSANNKKGDKLGLKVPFMSLTLSFFSMAVLWIVLSGRLDFFHLSLGFLSSLIVALFSWDLLYPEGKISVLGGRLLRFTGYVPWLLYQIFLANIHVLYLAFHPNMKELIDPRIIEFKSRLKGDYAMTTFANSITLTPGTITVHVSVMGKFVVHCIDVRSGESLPGEMEARVTRIFGE